MSKIGRTINIFRLVSIRHKLLLLLISVAVSMVVSDMVVFTDDSSEEIEGPKESHSHYEEMDEGSAHDKDDVESSDEDNVIEEPEEN